MKKKLFAITALLILSVMVFAACGGVPSAIKKPPETPAELKTALDGDGWETESRELGTLTIVIATKDDFSDKETEPAADASVSIEAAIVMYFPDESTATLSFDALEPSFKTMQDDANKDAPSGSKVEISVSQSGKSVSIYLAATGKYSDIGSGSDSMLGTLMDAIGSGLDF